MKHSNSVTAVTLINVQSHVANVSKAELMTTTSFKQFKNLLKKARWQRLLVILLLKENCIGL